jgi:hypothetical protein
MPLLGRAPLSPPGGYTRIDGGQTEEPHVRRAVAGGPVAVELGPLRLGEHVEAEAEVRLVGEAAHDR